MIAMTLGEVAAATGGRLAGGARPDTVVSGAVEFDSRRAGPGGLFFALPGTRTDGHEHVADALARGAVAAVVAREVGRPTVVVDDVQRALRRLAAEVVGRLPELVVVGLTGSSGKTTTKDLLAALLARLGPTVAPPGSFNNEIGYPYTVLRAGPDTRYLVLEASARGAGHIAALCRIAPPRIGMVLNVGSAHLGEFGSRAAIAAAKGELVEELPAAADGGLAVLGADDPVVRGLAARTRARVLLAGRADDADVRADAVGLDRCARASFTLHAAGRVVPVRLRLVGEHQVANATAAAAVAIALGLPPEQVAEVLAAAGPASPWRMDLRERADGVRVVNDAYNANPESMAAALRTLATLRGRRSWAVLGEMAELGAAAEEEHERIGALAADLGVDRLVAVGAAAPIVRAAAARPGWHGRAVGVPDADAALAELSGVGPGDVVLVKASRAAGLERVALALLGDAT